MSYQDFAPTFAAIGASIFAFLWMLFLKEVNIFSPLKWKDILVAFCFGALSVPLVFLVPDLYDKADAEVESIFLKELLNTAIVEEACKGMLFFLCFVLFRKRFSDAPDFLIFASLVGLGFASVENFMYLNRNIDVFLIRGTVSAFIHMAGTATIGYGFYVGRIAGKGKEFLYPVAGFLLAAVYHALYNTSLVVASGLDFLFLFVALVVFLLYAELWASMLNNLLNRSSFFEERITLNQDRIKVMLSGVYLFAIIFQLVASTIAESTLGLVIAIGMIVLQFAVMFLLINRITRFVLIRDHQESLLPRLPVTYKNYSVDDDPEGTFLRIRGIEFNDYHYTRHLGSSVEILPMGKRGGYIEKPEQITITSKSYIGTDMIAYGIEFLSGSDLDETFFLMPKIHGIPDIMDMPVCGLFSVNGSLSELYLTENDRPKFRGWIVIREKIETYKYVPSILQAMGIRKESKTEN